MCVMVFWAIPSFPIVMTVLSVLPFFLSSLSSALSMCVETMASFINIHSYYVVV